MNLVGFGTYPLRGEVCQRAVQDACALSYRLIDTATFYHNFGPVGQAVKNSGIDRDQFTINSKVWPDSQTPNKLQADLKQTLTDLQVDYIDTYFLHWPNSQLSIQAIWAAMKALQKAGKIRHIGLSNVTVNHLQRVHNLGLTIDQVQVEMHPLFYDKALTDYCHAHGIGVQAWAPLARGRLRNDPLLTEIGQKYQKTPEQIALRWIVQHQCVPLPGSQNPKHMQQNLAVDDITLTDAEMQLISTRAAQGERQRITLAKELGFTDEFDFSYADCWPASS